MPVEFNCPQCLHPQKVDESKVGQQVYCRVCYYKLTVPAESTNKPIDESQLYTLDAKSLTLKSREEQDRQELFSFRCDTCKTIISVRKEQVGEEIICAECGKTIIVPKSIAEKAKARLEAKLDKALALLFPKETYSLRGGTTAPTNDAPKQFRFSCRLCGTALFATQEQIGTDVSCHDCETKTTVPSQEIASKPAPLPPAAFEGSTAYKLATSSKFGAEKIGAEEQSSAVPTENLVPVVCHFCGTRMHAAESQIGQSKTCPDCGKSTEIKEVPKPQKITTETTSADAYVLNKVDETAPRPATTFLISLSPATLRRRLNDSESCRSLERPPLPKRPLTERFFVPFAHSDTWLNLLMFVSVFPLGMMIIMWIDSIDPTKIVVFVFAAPIVAIYVVAFAYFATYLLHFYDFTSSGMDKEEFKGELAPMDNFSNGLWLVAFSIVAITPGFLLGKLFVLEALLIAVMMRISHWIFFPICFLSSMETGSIFSVFAKNTIASLFRQPSVWLRFYLLTGALFILAGLCLIGFSWLVSAWLPPAMSFLVAFTLIFFLFAIQSLFFFRLLGRLAWTIEETDRQKRELEEEGE